MDKYDNQRRWIDARLIDEIEYVPIDVPKPYARPLRKHSKRQMNALTKSVRFFGLVLPPLVNEDDTVIAGEALIEVAKRLGYTEIPILRVKHLPEESIKALRIALNKLAELGEWDEESLAAELQFLIDIEFDVELTGFDMAEIDLVIGNQLAPISLTSADEIPETEPTAVSVVGDLWRLGEHLALCADARSAGAYRYLLQDSLAEMLITDPPWNLRVQGHIGGSGDIKHDEFVMASGEMSDDEFEAFLRDVIENLVETTSSGSLHYIFIDWRHLDVLQRIAAELYTRQINLCVWVKRNGGMGSMYRSRHELVPIYKSGDAPHKNRIQLGRYGRSRTTVWEYDGCNSFSPERRADLVLHPTPKPVALVADAIRDASDRGGLILDPFLGSGTTVIACEETGRVCAGMELDPRYVDVIVRRWEAFTGDEARHAETGRTFRETEADRTSGPLLLPAPAETTEA